MSDWSLRLAKPDDAKYLPEIEQAAGALFADDPDLANLDFSDGWSEEEFAGLIRKGHSLIAEIRGEIVGFLVTQPYKRELHIWEMDVHPSAQKQGIGAGLLRACMIDARNCGFSALTLTTFSDLVWNGPFYRALGFTEISDPAAHPRLTAELKEEAESGLPEERRCAMIYFLE